MRKVMVPVALVLLWSGHALTGVPALGQEGDPKTEAGKWIAKADSVQAVVDGAVQAAVEAGAEDHPVAKGSLADARHWVAEAEKTLKSARDANEAEDYGKAATLGNMAWQYYVKAGSAAVRAGRLAGGDE